MRCTLDTFQHLRQGSVVVYGGSFDPPTQAHERLPALAAAHIHAERLVYIPAARSPFKPNPPIASNEHRKNMLKLLSPSCHAQIDSVISPIEIDTLVDPQTSPSYSIDTLTQLKAQAPRRVQLRLLIGEDQARSFHRWKDARVIFDIAPPLVMRRKSSDRDESLIQALSAHWSSADLITWEQSLVPVPEIDAAATTARDLLSNNRQSPQLESLLTPLILEYIHTNSLYI